MVQKRPRKVRKRPRRTRCPISNFFAACETEGMRRQQAKRGQRSLRTVTTRETGSVARHHAHAPAATGQGRPRERLRSQETAFAAHVRPRAHAKQETGAEQALRAAQRHARAPAARRVPAATGTTVLHQHAGGAVVAAAGARARPQGTAAEGTCWLQRGRHGWLQMRLLEHAGAAPSTPPDGPPRQLRQRWRTRIPRTPTRARTWATGHTRGPRDGPMRPHGAM